MPIHIAITRQVRPSCEAERMFTITKPSKA
jgi:hypothetical protein